MAELHDVGLVLLGGAIIGLQLADHLLPALLNSIVNSLPQGFHHTVQFVIGGVLLLVLDAVVLGISRRRPLSMAHRLEAVPKGLVLADAANVVRWRPVIASSTWHIGRAAFALAWSARSLAKLHRWLLRLLKTL